MTIGERIRQRRIELGITQDELARAVGYKSRSSINKIELARDLPLPKVELVAKALRCTPMALMGWEDVSPSSSLREDSDLIYPAPETFSEILSRHEFELIDFYRHCDKWGRKAIIDTAKRELKRCQSEGARNGYR